MTDLSFGASHKYAGGTAGVWQRGGDLGRGEGTRIGEAGGCLDALLSLHT